jgi:hypothetical protein
MDPETAGVSAEDFLIIVDNLMDGTCAYLVDYFEVDVRRAVLRPVFGGGMRMRD